MTDRIYYEVSLPSKGLLYENRLSVVEVAPMRTIEEKYLAAGRKDWVQSLNRILTNCIKDLKGMSAQDLLSGDRIFLLFCIRMFSYGKDYSFMIKCPDCGARFRHTMLIMDDLRIFELPDDASEPFYTKLPQSGLKIGFRLLRGYDEMQIDKYVSREMMRTSSETAPFDAGYVHRLARHIVSVNDNEVSLMDAEHIIENLNAGDSLYLRESIDAVDCGIDLNINIECPSCGYYIEEIMPFTKEFFRPVRITRRDNRPAASFIRNQG